MELIYGPALHMETYYADTSPSIAPKPLDMYTPGRPAIVWATATRASVYNLLIP